MNQLPKWFPGVCGIAGGCILFLSLSVVLYDAPRAGNLWLALFVSVLRFSVALSLCLRPGEREDESRQRECDWVTGGSPHFRSLAVTILGIGTAVLGFGLFGAGLSKESISLWPKLTAGGIALVYYLMLVGSVRKILTAADVTGEDVEQGPLFWMTQIMGSMAVIFIADVAGILLSD